MSINIPFNGGRSLEVVSVNLINDDIAEPTEKFVIEIVKITPGAFNMTPGMSPCQEKSFWMMMVICM